MSTHYGDIPAGQVIYHMFDTFAGTTGASITMTGLAVTDIEVYKNGGTTQRASDAGYTLLDTDGIDFDGLTGIHGFSIDTGNNTDAGFFSVGGWYNVVVSAITVDSQTVSFVACSFRLVAAEASAGLPSVNTTHAAGTAWNSGAIGASTLAADTLTAAKIASDVTTELQSGLATAAALATVDGIVDNLVSGIIFGAAATGTLSTTQASTNLTGYANDQLIGRPVIWLTGACEGEASVITDYVATAGVLTFDALTAAPGNGDTFKIV